MDDADGVGGRQRGADPVGQLQRAAGLQRALLLDDLAEGRAVDLLHHEEEHALVHTPVVQRHHIRMADLRGGDRLAREPRRQVAARVVVEDEQLERHVAVQVVVAAGPDLAHPAPADPAH
ncbi:hypothetical protein OG946_08345 [Streptomyces sp. NBC_01808]|nr:hypothetical protein [Streptomyces sp. NBC_01808]WSA37386.1 hypothetical protein OG946_08345 [Streptomyces sp. NBC_01808]